MNSLHHARESGGTRDMDRAVIELPTAELYGPISIPAHRRRSVTAVDLAYPMGDICQFCEVLKRRCFGRFSKAVFRNVLKRGVSQQEIGHAINLFAKSDILHFVGIAKCPYLMRSARVNGSTIGPCLFAKIDCGAPPYRNSEQRI